MDEPIIPTQEVQSPIQPRQWPLDQQLRKESLDNAVVLALRWDKKDIKINEVMEMADAFYNFLKEQDEKTG